MAETHPREIRLIDGEERNRQFPDTFEIPSAGRIANIVPGDFVKIGVEFPIIDDCDAERFWLQVTDRHGDSLTGKVSNDLVYTAAHGLADGDVVTVRPQHVLAILKPAR